MLLGVAGLRLAMSWLAHGLEHVSNVGLALRYGSREDVLPAARAHERGEIEERKLSSVAA